ncbi:hypothetical protein BJV78DRAFT_896543 [Lactifluus subvellereus]|nr:hypothetical protein BJV78DRAFT_896543 [Lactifluus subvellereus]
MSFFFLCIVPLPVPARRLSLQRPTRSTRIFCRRFPSLKFSLSCYVLTISPCMANGRHAHRFPAHACVSASQLCTERACSRNQPQAINREKIIASICGMSDKRMREIPEEWGNDLRSLKKQENTIVPRDVCMYT